MIMIEMGRGRERSYNTGDDGTEAGVVVGGDNDGGDGDGADRSAD